MANIAKTIQYCIVFITLIISINVASLFILPGVLVFIPGLENAMLTQAWRSFNNALLHLVPTILMAFFVLYLVYKIASKIFPINLFIGKIPPFRELRQAGIFGLFDNLLRALGAHSTKDKLFGVVRAFVNFLKANFIMTRNTIREILGINVNVTPANLPHQSTPQDFPEPDMSATPTPFSDEEVAQTNLEYQQCLEETLIKITPDMDKNEVQIAQLKNSTANMYCQVVALQNTLNNFAFKV
jgi:hypothetical protein